MTATTSEPVPIRVRGLRKLYDGHAAVDGLDLDVHRGEVFALLGPNGAGKTTTVEILEGYRARDGGEVSVLGIDPARADAAWRARVGVVLQSATDAGELTVKEIVEHFAGYYPNPRDPAGTIALVGLEEKRTSRIRTLSGGQRRRLDVALGILGHPELVFLDEPTTGFDPEARRQFWDLVRLLGHEGSTVVLTTHYLDEAEALADRVAVISSGRIVALDTPAELGGRSTARPVVRWRDGEQATHEPTRLIRELAERYGGEVPGLQIHRPTLEDIYLELIDGRNGRRGAALEPAVDVMTESTESKETV